MHKITQTATTQQATDAVRSAARLFDRAAGFGVVLSRGTATVADVEGLGAAWAAGARFWLEIPDGPPYLILGASDRDHLHNPSAFLARDTDALRHAAALLTQRTHGPVLWSCCCSPAAWKIIVDFVAETTSTEGTA